jgi:hypothetical protein
MTEGKTMHYERWISRIFSEAPQRTSEILRFLWTTRTFR